MKAIFLDDKLYLHVKYRVIENPEDMKECIIECYKLCEDYYKGKMPSLVGRSYKEVTQLLDKTFKFWDMFVAKLEKENFWGISVFQIPGISYKESFLRHPELKRIYELGK